MQRRNTTLIMRSWKKNRLVVEQERLSEIKNIQVNVSQSLVFLLGFEKHADNFNPIGNDLQCYWGLR